MSTEGENLFKMAAMIKVRGSGYEVLRLVKNKQNGGKGKLVWLGCAFKVSAYPK